jgi:hypothetical protein
MFSLQRFLRLANAHWAEYRKAYAWFIAIGIMVHFVLLLVIFSDAHGFTSLGTEGQSAIYYAGLFLTAPIFAARYFQKMSKRESALIVLMQPASVFEKWLLAFLFVAVLYPVVYTLAFYVCNFPAALIVKAQVQSYVLQNPQALNEVNSYPEYSPELYDIFFPLSNISSWKLLVQLVLTLTILQAFAVLGSLYFKAMPFIKTILVAFFILLISIFVSVFFRSNPDAFFAAWSAANQVQEPIDFMYLFTWFSVPILLWISCFFALKEREVA